MSFRRTKYENYDKESKDRLQKVIHHLLAVLAVLLGLFLLSFALTGAGLFPGNIIHRFVVSSYLGENYTDFDIVSYDKYDSSTGNFIYNCTVNGASCKIGAGNFRVRYDGYYNDNGRNRYFEGAVQDYLNDFLNNKWAEQYSDNSAVWESYIDIPLSDAAYPSSDDVQPDVRDELIQNALKAYGGSLDFTLEIHGESVSMDDYTAIVYKAVSILQQEMYNRPSKLQVYYYRSEGGGDVMQYESTVSTFQFNYNESGIRQASDIHRYAEVPAELESKVNIYYTVRSIFLAVVSVTVIALCVLWCVRKIKKHRRYNKPGPDGNIDNL